MSKKASDNRTFFTKPVSATAKQDEYVCKTQPCSSDVSTTIRPRPTSAHSDPCFSLDDGCNKLDLGDKVTGPSRPILHSYPLSQFKHFQRAFSATYFRKFTWLEYSVKNDAVFCYPCKQFPSYKKEDLLTEKGLSNWKKLNEKLEKHASSESHLLSMAKWTNFHKPTETVISQISSTHKLLVTENREYLKKILGLLFVVTMNPQPQITKRTS